MSDKDELLDALYEVAESTGKRPSIVNVGMSRFPDWSRDRLFDAAQALENDREIMNATSAAAYVDLTSTGRKRAMERRAQGAPQSATHTITIGSVHNSPIQQIGQGGHGVQNTSYSFNATDLRQIIELYRANVDTLGLDTAAKKRADAQVATIEAQLQDEPNPVIVREAGKSLRSIVENALGGAAGAAITSPGVWEPLLNLFL